MTPDGLRSHTCVDLTRDSGKESAWLFSVQERALSRGPALHLNNLSERIGFRNEQPFLFHEFQMQPHSFGNQFFGFLECLARSYTSRQLRQLRRIPDLIVSLELYPVSHRGPYALLIDGLVNYAASRTATATLPRTLQEKEVRGADVPACWTILIQVQPETAKPEVTPG